MVEVVHERAAGLDLHKRTVVACTLVPGAAGKPTKALRTFGTMTEDILALGDWLAAQGVTHVAMESTGVYWKPVWNLLEDRFELLLANAHHIKAVPGRKTDVKDAEWIADLLRHGLLQASLVPDRFQRELRELTRYRTELTRERAAEVNRLQKTLEGANIKLAAVVSEIDGKSAREMLDALVDGATDVGALAQLARGRLREKTKELERALAGSFGAHQRFLVARHLALLDAFDDSIAQVSGELAERMRPFERPLAHLDTIPGVGQRTAEVVIAEMGTDMDRFPSAAHLAAWAGLAPGNYESAGKQRRGTTRQGNPALKTCLVEAANAAVRTKGSYAAAQYHRLAARRGRKRALVAVAHSLLVAAYHMLKRGEDYRDLGPTHFDDRDRHAVSKRLTQRLEQLGYDVELHQRAAA
jgi:transposase